VTPVICIKKPETCGNLIPDRILDYPADRALLVNHGLDIHPTSNVERKSSRSFRSVEAPYDTADVARQIYSLSDPNRRAYREVRSQRSAMRV